MDLPLPLLFSIFGLCMPSLYDPQRFHCINLKMTWADAQQYCTVKYNDLATFESKTAMSSLSRPGISQAWIGLTGDQGHQQTLYSWSWSNTGGIKTGYENWKINHPDNNNGEKPCVVITEDGTWMNSDCNRTFFVGCFTAADSFGKKKYHVIWEALTWVDAQTYCRTHFTDLALIENGQENSELLLVKGQEAKWVWIGLYRDTWNQSDNRKWREGQPKNSHHQFCATADFTHGPEVRNCEDKFPFCCQEVFKYMKTFQIKIQSDADLSNPALNSQLLQQLGVKQSNISGVTNLKWKIQPRKIQEKQKVEDQCPAK